MTSGFRVATWNIHGCVGTDGVFDRERTAGVIKSLDASIVALQEVDDGWRGPPGLDMFEFLRTQIGDHAVHARAIIAADGHYGQMLASRWPFVESRIHDISVAGREPRRLIDAVIDTGARHWRILATHLGLRLGERGRQLDHIRDVLAKERGLPTILLGDFNVWYPRSRALKRLSGHMPCRSYHATFPSRFPLFPLDRIWSDAVEAWEHSATVTSARPASDHLPVVAHFREPPC
ncbi:endonuclease/exonuclease/phosphatase family protein [Oceanibacterium hippocampi]|uniref:Endonuclease/exonuclease/phosphatase domain-containing protein n=1 Tax=Oceanibacterium hippocampi TaxID=745714 RepID=A0A1Y5TVF6_9PROT|nr:endonuclease/exonuclease/phosphatase family protein [Oceanibacterium hippocampi]SLN69357.1 hypothetical protein OCH7691_03182 [Oceanibacterium hippocampi]